MTHTQTHTHTHTQTERKSEIDRNSLEIFLLSSSSRSICTAFRNLSQWADTIIVCLNLLTLFLNIILFNWYKLFVSGMEDSIKLVSPTISR